MQLYVRPAWNLALTPAFAKSERCVALESLRIYITVRQFSALSVQRPISEFSAQCYRRSSRLPMDRLVVTWYAKSGDTSSALPELSCNGKPSPPRRP